MTCPAKLQALKKTPGLYLCRANCLFVICIDNAEKIHQVNLHTWRNDGELDDEGWSDLPLAQHLVVYRLEEMQ